MSIVHRNPETERVPFTAMARCSDFSIKWADPVRVIGQLREARSDEYVQSEETQRSKADTFAFNDIHRIGRVFGTVEPGGHFR